MKNFFKTFASLIIAIAILMGILFLPEANLNFIRKFLDVLIHSNNQTNFYTKYMLQKFTTGSIVLGITILISVITHKAYKSTKEEEN